MIGADFLYDEQAPVMQQSGVLPNTSIAERAKETTTSGKASLNVPDEDHEGQPAHLVLVGPDGQLLADRDVVVGKNR